MSASSNVKLLLCFNNTSKLALSIPLAECTNFALTPLKWLRFLGFIIYGRQGHLSTSMNGPELDYTAEIEARSYYFISNGEPRLADVDVINNRTSNASELSTGRADFRQKLIERDGTCVLTGDRPFYCDACHFLPHSKGDTYMSNLFNYRHETYDLVDSLDDINDTRNGILLNVALHRSLDVGEIAFLKTPNFALSVDDIPYHQPPNTGSPQNRFTLQHIRPSDLGRGVTQLGPHNSDAREPQDISQWPLGIIVDLSYAAAVIQAWGPKTFIKYVRANSKDSYYKSGMEVDDSGDASRDLTPKVPHHPSARNERCIRRSENKAKAVDPGTSDDMDIFDVLLTLWTRAAREYEGERKLPGGDAADVAENISKVQTWLQSMEESTL